jgi:RNA polymerase sigma-70 factor (ECF subfamily)
LDNEKVFISELQNPKTAIKAFEKLVVTYQKPLYFHIRSILKNHDDTDDVLQNVFIKVYRNIDKFKGESKLFSWLYRIASNEAYTFFQQQKNNFKHSDEAFNDYQLNNLKADIYFDGDEITLKLHKAIQTLPEKQKQVFQMKYFESLKYEEMSEILGTSVGALKASYHLAVKKIEKYLTAD